MASNPKTRIAIPPQVTVVQRPLVAPPPGLTRQPSPLFPPRPPAPPQLGPPSFPTRQSASVLLPQQVKVVQPQSLPPQVNPRVYRPLDGRLPLHLSASTTVSPNSGGNVNAISLKNPMGRAMEILEIKWQVAVTVSNTVGSPGDATGVLGGTLGCKLQLGETPLTNGFIPVWNFGRAECLGCEVVTSGSPQKYFSEYSWKLPRPLYVPAGTVVLPSFQHRGLLNGNVDVTVSYSARDLPEGYRPPAKVAVPFACAFTSKSFNPTTASSDVSSETDIANPFNEPLIIQRMSGRAPLLESVLGSPALNYETGAASIFSQINVRIVDSYGRPIIRDFTPLRQAFSAVTRTWEMDGQQVVMDPKSFYRVYIRFDAPSNTIVSNATFASQAQIGLVGYREVKS